MASRGGRAEQEQARSTDAGQTVSGARQAEIINTIEIEYGFNALSVCFSGLEDMLMVRTNNGDLMVYSVDGATFVCTIPDVSCAAFVPGSNNLICYGTKEGVVLQHDCDTGEARRIHKFKDGRAVTCIDVSIDGCSVVAGDRFGVTVLLDLTTPEPRQHPVHNETGDRMTSVAFSRDGMYFAKADVGGKVYVFETATVACIAEARFVEDEVVRVSFTGDNEKLFLSSSPKTGEWNWAESKIRTIQLGESEIDAGAGAGADVNYTEDGFYFFSLSDDGGACVRDFQHGVCVRKLLCDQTICCGRFAPNSRMVATGTIDGQVLLWDLHFARVNRTQLSNEGWLRETGAYDRLRGMSRSDRSGGVQRMRELVHLRMKHHGDDNEIAKALQAKMEGGGRREHRRESAPRRVRLADLTLGSA